MMDDQQPIRRRRKSAISRDAGKSPPDVARALELARRIGAAGFRTTLGWQIARTLFRIFFAGSLAAFAGHLIEYGTFDVTLLTFMLVSLILAGASGLFAELRAASAEAELVDGIRATLQETLAGMSPARIRTKPSGEMIAGLQRHPPALASLVISHSAARSLLGISPLLVAGTLAFLSWQAMLMLLLAIPVMIIFFVMLGSMVRGKAEIQEKSYGRLAAQFSDRIRTLPTVLANHALLREHGKIERRMTTYADSTMGVLKVAFLNAGIIDFFSALAIAVLAVLLGLGHLGLAHVPGFSGLALWQTLFILIIAAEFFAPFRRYAELYHVKAEGQAAAKELDWFFDDASAASSGSGDMTRPFIPEGAGDLTAFPSVGLVVISGPSGSGKSTLLRILAGIETPVSDVAPIGCMQVSGCDWISTEIYVPAGSLADAVAWSRGPLDRAAVLDACERVGLLDDSLLPGALDAPVAEGGGNLSGGQRMRIGIARALLSEAGAVLADEPTAKLDPLTARSVRQALIEVAGRRLVIVATHDAALIEAASVHYTLAPQHQSRKAVAA